MKFSLFEKLFGNSKNENQSPPAVTERPREPEIRSAHIHTNPAPPTAAPPRNFNSSTQQKRQAMEESGRAGDLNTIIGKGALIEGTIKVQNSMRLDGKVTGHILTTDSLVVGKEGEVNGEVRTKNAVIGGRIKGQVFASGKVVLEARAALTGDIKTAKLMINDGARFDGHVAMSEDGGLKTIAQSSQTRGPGTHEKTADKR
jgi:cytoskeletal protein CcmA (bactofilin family)